MRAPLVTRDEASRIFALAGLVALLVFVPITRRALAPRPLAPTASCVDGAHRRADGAVACGRTGERLPARAELLLGTPLELNDAAASELELVPG
ncbi:hypothetical protein L6R52_31560, partial [Myxococcota bacterium]|nr:hypothetical protein [Myxococcota bacterium]